MFESDAAKQQADNATHLDRIAEKVTRIGNKHDDAALELGKSTKLCMLEQERTSQAEYDTQHHAEREHHGKNPKPIENRQERQFWSTELIQRLKHDNRDGIIQHTFAKNYAVQLWIHFVCVENRQDRNRISRT